MKLILSRKGFDSGSGGYPSPIFPDDSMVSLPIPFPTATHRMHLATKNNPHFLERDIVMDLTAERYDRLSGVHLDPYLTKNDSTPGGEGWRQAFGQDGAAQGHLSNQEVAAGDLFLFFGWFRRVDKVGERWQYVRTSPAIHALFGWLQIGEVLKQEAIASCSDIRPWLSDHPHVLHADRMMSGNTVYIATERLIVGGKDFCPGGGTFGRFYERLQLTAPPAAGRGHSYWRLPHWFHPDFDAAPTLTFHGRPDRWSTNGFGDAHIGLQTVARGQEFVIDLQGKRADEATKWLTSIFRSPP